MNWLASNRMTLRRHHCYDHYWKLATKAVSSSSISKKKSYQSHTLILCDCTNFADFFLTMLSQWTEKAVGWVRRVVVSSENCHSDHSILSFDGIKLRLRQYGSFQLPKTKHRSAHWDSGWEWNWQPIGSRNRVVGVTFFDGSTTRRWVLNSRQERGRKPLRNSTWVCSFTLYFVAEQRNYHLSLLSNDKGLICFRLETNTKWSSPIVKEDCQCERSNLPKHRQNVEKVQRAWRDFCNNAVDVIPRP